MKTLSKYETIAYQYDSPIELKEHREKMVFEGWEVQEWDNEQLIVEYFRRTFF